MGKGFLLIWYGPLVAKKINDKAQQNLRKACIIAETEAKRLAPVDTGRLKSSITHRVSAFRAEIGSPVHYAAYQEFGTRKMEAHPYLRPAIINKWDEIVKAIGGGLCE